MKNRFIRCFFILASVLMAQAVHAEKSATFTLFTPRYYLGTAMVASSPSFILGQRGAITSSESFPSSATYAVSTAKLPSGYYVSKWLLSTSWGAGMSGTTIKSQEGGTSFEVKFDYKWAAKYGTTALDLTVYLEPITYQLSYAANGGKWTAGEPEGGTYRYADTVTAPSAGSVEYDNHALTGWKSKTGKLVAVGAAFDGSSVGVTGDGQSVTLYAQWKSAEYKVTLHENGGILDKELTGYTYGVGATLPGATKKNCKFEGWYDNPSFISNVVTKISKTDSGDMEFWAKFTQQDTVVHYNGNGATSGTMSDSSFVYNKPMALTANAFGRAYTVTYDANGGSVGTKSDTATYTFKCWNNKANGTGAYSYKDLQDVTNPCGSTGESVTLFAQWDTEPVTVTLPVAKAPKEDKDFAGWFTAQAGGVRVGDAGDLYEPPRSITLYAQWKSKTGANTYNIKFSPGADVADYDAMASETKQGVAGGSSITLPPSTYQTISYENLASTNCIGWHWKNTTYGLSSEFKREDVRDGETIVMRAVWEDNQGVLSQAVDLKNAVLDSSDWKVKDKEGRKGTGCVGYYGDRNNSEISMKVRGAGTVKFYWKSWQESKPGPAALISTGSKSEEIAVSTADWEAKSFHVTGEGVHEIVWSANTDAIADYRMDDVEWIPDSPSKFAITTSSYPEAAGKTAGGGTYEVGKTVTLTATANANYQFLHWSDGSTNNPYTVTVCCKESYEAVFSGDGETKYFYVLFNGNGADNLAAMDGQRIPCGTTEALTANKFTRSGYTFAGWATKRTGAVVYKDKASVKDLAAQDGTVTLYAVWEDVPEPEPGKTAVTVTITGATKTVKYTGKKQTVSGYTFSSDVAAYKKTFFNFTGEAEASGTEAGTYWMGLSPSDFKNKDDDYSVTFVVNDGKLVVTGDDPEPEPGAYECTVGEKVEVDLAADYPGYTIKSVSGLPSGLKYYTASGYVKGTPTAAGTKTATVKFSDGSSAKATWKVAAGENHGVTVDFGEAATGETTAQVRIGTAVSWTLEAEEAGAKVTVSKLPTGLKYSKTTGLITGTPTKAGTFAMTVKTVANGITVTQTFEVTVEALPKMMVGTYYGMAATADGSAGQFQLKLTAAGKATGYFYAAGKKISLKSTALVGEGDDCYSLTVTYKYGGATQTDVLMLILDGESEGVDFWCAAVAESEVLDDVDALRDAIKEAGVSLSAGTYAVDDDSLEETDDLKAKVTKAGAVTVSGKLADANGKPVSVSCSTHLVTADDGLPYCWVTIYKTVRGQDPIERCFPWYLPTAD